MAAVARRGVPGKATGLTIVVALALAGCASEESVPVRSALSPAQVRALVERALPATLADRSGWAADIQAALTALEVLPTVANVCASVAVIEQESSFRANPTVPGLSRIAWREIDAKAERAGVPVLVVHAALKLPSPDGRSFSERIDAATTEKDLSDLFDDFIGMVPLGQRWLAGINPVRTGGPMQVGISFAEAHAKRRPYPYASGGSIRQEVFTRRGGVYFGIAHLYDYPANYDRLIYRFADYNAGHFASRNAAFQQAVSRLTGIELAFDGDLLVPGDKSAAGGATEQATRSLALRLGFPVEQVRETLAQQHSRAFDDRPLVRRVFEEADRVLGERQPRAIVPRIPLKSPKFTRPLTTEWFAQRVDDRLRRCQARLATPPADGGAPRSLL